MGSDVRLLVGEPPSRGCRAPRQPPAGCATSWRTSTRVCRRFRADSELSLLNADPRTSVPASKLLRTAVRAALWAAERTDGLLDPTLVDELEQAGYDALAGRRHAGVARGRRSPRRRRARPATPDPAQRWREIVVDEAAGTVTRPPGLRIDSGGTGKGLAADLASGMLRGYSRFVVDCGGDMRVGGPDAEQEPYRVEVEHPLTGERVIALLLSSGGVATSGLNVRIWRTPAREFAHHLLDPATGEPAWTGLVGVTAIGSTALHAETLAKAALLSGPQSARGWLADLGGVLVDYSGQVEYVGLREVSSAAHPIPASRNSRSRPNPTQRSETMKLIPQVDESACAAHGDCVDVAPEVFELARRCSWWWARARRTSIMKAARACPSSAITVIDADTGEQVYP